MAESNSRIIQRLSIENRDGTSRQTIVRSPSGAIDYEFYEARARQGRSEAFASIVAMLPVVMRRALRRIRVRRKPSSRPTPCKGNCHSAG